MPITMFDTTRDDASGSIAALGRRHRLSAYDATYLALAARDKALRQAAADSGVSLFEP